MYPVGKFISQGLYSVSGPFHPFGGAVDIIVVEQEDGSYKSSPWYVRFGKFQGVLKRREKTVKITVNDVEADFHMYLDTNGEAYFLKDADDAKEDSTLLLSPAIGISSGEDTGAHEQLQLEHMEDKDDSDTKDTSYIASSDHLKAVNPVASSVVDARDSVKASTSGGPSVADQPSSFKEIKHFKQAVEQVLETCTEEPAVAGSEGECRQSDAENAGMLHELNDSEGIRGNTSCAVTVEAPANSVGDDDHQSVSSQGAAPNGLPVGTSVITDDEQSDNIGNVLLDDVASSHISSTSLSSQGMLNSPQQQMLEPVISTASSSLDAGSRLPAEMAMAISTTAAQLGSVTTLATSRKGEFASFTTAGSRFAGKVQNPGAPLPGVEQESSSTPQIVSKAGRSLSYPLTQTPSSAASLQSQPSGISLDSSHEVVTEAREGREEDPKLEAAVQQEFAWREVVERAALVLEKAPSSSRLHWEACKKEEEDAREGRKRKGWGWWGWRSQKRLDGELKGDLANQQVQKDGSQRAGGQGKGMKIDAERAEFVAALMDRSWMEKNKKGKDSVAKVAAKMAAAAAVASIRSGPSEVGSRQAGSAEGTGAPGTGELPPSDPPMVLQKPDQAKLQPVIEECTTRKAANKSRLIEAQECQRLTEGIATSSQASANGVDAELSRAQRRYGKGAQQLRKASGHGLSERSRPALKEGTESLTKMLVHADLENASALMHLRGGSQGWELNGSPVLGVDPDAGGEALQAQLEEFLLAQIQRGSSRNSDVALSAQETEGEEEPDGGEFHSAESTDVEEALAAVKEGGGQQELVAAMEASLRSRSNSMCTLLSNSGSTGVEAADRKQVEKEPGKPLTPPDSVILVSIDGRMVVAKVAAEDLPALANTDVYKGQHTGVIGLPDQESSGIEISQNAGNADVKDWTEGEAKLHEQQEGKPVSSLAHVVGNEPGNEGNVPGSHKETPAAEETVKEHLAATEGEAEHQLSGSSLRQEARDLEHSMTKEGAPGGLPLGRSEALGLDGNLESFSDSNSKGSNPVEDNLYLAGPRDKSDPIVNIHSPVREGELIMNKKTFRVKSKHNEGTLEMAVNNHSEDAFCPPIHVPSSAIITPQPGMPSSGSIIGVGPGDSRLQNGPSIASGSKPFLSSAEELGPGVPEPARYNLTPVSLPKSFEHHLRNVESSEVGRLGSGKDGTVESEGVSSSSDDEAFRSCRNSDVGLSDLILSAEQQQDILTSISEGLEIEGQSPHSISSNACTPCSSGADAGGHSRNPSQDVHESENGGAAGRRSSTPTESAGEDGVSVGSSSDGNRYASQGTGLDLSLCHHLLYSGMGVQAAQQAFERARVSADQLARQGNRVLSNERLVVRVGGRYYPWASAAPKLVSMLAFGRVVPPFTGDLDGAIDVERQPKGLRSKTRTKQGQQNQQVEATSVDVSSRALVQASGWKLWPFGSTRSSPLTPQVDVPGGSSLQTDVMLVAARVALDNPQLFGLTSFYGRPRKVRVRTVLPTPEQVASLPLRPGKNRLTFTFTTRVLGSQQVDCTMYVWKWNARVVISDVDGTITRSDVLGQVMPLVGRDWSQSGVARLFSAIKENGYELMFLSARSISQAYLTRNFLFNLKQGGQSLPEGPVVISPDGLFPSLYREVIRRAPQEFKIACLQDIKALFPADRSPFYAGFGNRETDELSYQAVGIPKGKIFTINPKGEVAVNNRVAVKTYTSLHDLVHDMFPATSAEASHPEQEDFNSWNFWKMPLPDIEDEISDSSSSKKPNYSKSNSLSLIMSGSRDSQAAMRIARSKSTS